MVFESFVMKTHKSGVTPRHVSDKMLQQSSSSALLPVLGVVKNRCFHRHVVGFVDGHVTKAAQNRPHFQKGGRRATTPSPIPNNLKP